MSEKFDGIRSYWDGMQREMESIEGEGEGEITAQKRNRLVLKKTKTSY